MGAFVALVCLLSLLGRASAHAQYDPKLNFRTVETEHLKVHYHEGYYEFALDVAKVGEASYAVITELLGHDVKEKIEVVVSDDTDDANGSATVLPYPIVRAYVTSPDDLSFLSEHNYWIYELIGHEITHVVHLDTTGNVSKILNTILGRTWFPNQLQSRWFIEGLAVEVESRISVGGRARSRLVDMVFRAEAIEDNPVRLDQALSGPLRWPQGNTWYLHGGRFLSYVADRFGHDALREISNQYGGTLIPYAMNRAFKRVTGVDYDDVWAAFQKTLHDEYAEQLAHVQRHPLAQGAPLTNAGQQNYNPRYTPDGKVLYFAEGYSRIPQLRVIDITSGDLTSGSDRELDKFNGQGQSAQPGADGHVILSQIEVWRTFYPFHDLFDYDLGSGRFTRLSEGLRARDPTVTADGRTVYFVQNLGTRSRLMRAPLLRDSGSVSLGKHEVVWDPGGSYQLYVPRLSPDDSTIAVSVFRPPGQRDVALVYLTSPDDGSGSDKSGSGESDSQPSGPLVDWVTDDEALDSGPTWSPDGRTLYFHSARSGIYNIYAYTPADTVLRQVTNTMTGAFSPDIAPDGKSMVFMSYSSRGYDIATLPLDEATFLPAGTVERREPVAVAPGSLPAAAQAEPERLPSVPYNPWPTLLPRSWLILPATDALGTVLSLSVGGEDPLGRHRWAASLGFGLESLDVNYSLGYSNRQLYPALSIATYRNVQAAAGNARIDGRPVFVTERAHGLALDASFPLFRAVWSIVASVGYNFENRRRLTEFEISPDTPRPIFPPTGNLASVNASIAFSRLRRSVGAVSAEYGQRVTLSGQLREPWLGSDFRQGIVQATFATYHLMPWAMHHVLSLRATGGGGYSELASRALTSFGGIQLRDPVRDILFSNIIGDTFVRGYAPAAFAGNFYYTASLEYRAPLLRIERGIGVLPLYVRTLAAAAFVDVGNAQESSQLFRTTPGIGVGAELRLEIDYGFYYGATLRAGYARGLTRDGIHNVFLSVSNGF